MRTALLLALLVFGGLQPLTAQPTESPDSVSSPYRPSAPGLFSGVRLTPKLEAGLFVSGGGVLLAGQAVSDDPRPVPTTGLNRDEIRWGFDRDAVGHLNSSADAQSDWTLRAAQVYPLFLGLLTGPPGARWSHLGKTTLVTGEAVLLTSGLVVLGKKWIGRARPFAYVEAGTRPAGSQFDISQNRAFRSMPSGHSAFAWTGSSVAMTEYLLNRPAADWKKRMAVGVMGGALAGSTSYLRVESGQHFPSDVIAGAGVGLLFGTTIPLLHKGARPMPTRGAFFQMYGSAFLGALLASFAGQAF